MSGRRATSKDVVVHLKQREAMQQIRTRDEEDRIVSSRHSEVNLQIRRMVQGESREESKRQFTEACVWQTKKCKFTLGNLRSFWNILGKNLSGWIVLNIKLALVEV